MQSTTLKVTGMACEACVAHVTKALKSVPGVKVASVELEPGRATVQHENASAGAMIAAVDDAGYQAEQEK